MNALIIGGTRGIGKATADILLKQEWNVDAFGRQGFDVHWHYTSIPWTTLRLYVQEHGMYNAFVFCAGSLTDQWDDQFDYPMCFYRAVAEYGKELFAPRCAIIAVSSVGADSPAKVNPHYAAAKAALESYAKTLADAPETKELYWRVEIVRFDLVDTDMLKQLPEYTLKGRRVISPETAAQRIVMIINSYHMPIGKWD